MSGDRTVLKPGTPLFAIRETVYSRIAAIKGFVEPLVIVGIEFDPATAGYVYSFTRTTKLYSNRDQRLLPIKLYEPEILTLCEALDLQISVLSRELIESRRQFELNCLQAEVKPPPQTPVVSGDLSLPPPPRFGYNQVVYLRETAETVGRLEAFRINKFVWSDSVGQWIYTFHIKRRPGRTMTVGDRDDMSREFDLRYPEADLCLICEASPSVVKFAELALRRAQGRKIAYCPSSG